MYTLRIDTGPSIDSPDKFTAYMRRVMPAARDVPGIEAAASPTMFRSTASGRGPSGPQVNLATKLSAR